jgi:hypothetical protein
MDLTELLADAMRRRRLSTESLAYATGIRVPRVKAFVEDGADGPVRPTDDELTELAQALSLPPHAVLAACRKPRAAA